MTLAQTPNVDSSNWEASDWILSPRILAGWDPSGWVLLPHSSSVVAVAPPVATEDLQWGEPTDDMQRLGSQFALPLEGGPDERPSYEMVFEMLLRDYAHIWKALADR